MGWTEAKTTLAKLVTDLVNLTGDVRVLTAKTESAVAEVNRRVDSAEARIERKATDVEAHCDRQDQALESRISQSVSALESRMNERATAHQASVDAKLMDFERRLRDLESQVAQLHGFMGQVQGQAVAAIAAQMRREALSDVRPSPPPDGD